MSPAGERFAEEARAIPAIRYEEDFLDARLVFQALLPHAPERTPLRLKLLAYLLAPLVEIDVERARRDARFFGADDELERIYDSLRDALELVAPSELWGEDGIPRLSPGERDLLVRACRAAVSLFSPRGHELAVAASLYVLVTLEPGEPRWPERLQQLLGWIDTAAKLSGGPGSRPAITAADALDHVVQAWPAQAPVERLTGARLERANRGAGARRQPLGTGAKPDVRFGDDPADASVVNLVAPYLRCHELARAQAVAERRAGKPGDDAHLRRLLAAAARPGAKPADFLALARRFLPRIEILGGTSLDRLDAHAAAEVLRKGLLLHPADPDLLVLASRVARFLPAPFLAIRYLEEAQAVLEGTRASPDVLADVAGELLDLSFARMRVRMDPEHIAPAAREAEALRRRSAENRKRFGGSRFNLREADIDFELARGLVDAGLIERAEPILARVHGEDQASVEVTLQIAKLVGKRGAPARAARMLRDAIETQQRSVPAESVEFLAGRSKLARSLGDAHEAAGNLEEARRAWMLAAQGWERLMVELLRRRNLAASAEATFEVGRLYYLLGRRKEGIEKFGEAIEQNESRDQSYIDALAFLVQQGETEAALDIYRRALARPSRSVSEYVKVYASLWILDLTRRTHGAADPSAEAFLQGLDARKVHVRPARAAAWYVLLARYAIGRLTYQELLALADTPGKRAEVYFYEAMRCLAEGRSDDAHALWNKVLGTKMVSFFEFDMAARYLRSGAPSQPGGDPAAAETI